MLNYLKSLFTEDREIEALQWALGKEKNAVQMLKETLVNEGAIRERELYQRDQLILLLRQQLEEIRDILSVQYVLPHEGKQSSLTYIVSNTDLNGDYVNDVEHDN